MEYYTECTRLKNCNFFGSGETNYPDFVWILAPKVIDTPFGLYFLNKTDDDTIYGNTSSTVNQLSCVPQYQLHLQ